jgi:hypothetical protein
MNWESELIDLFSEIHFVADTAALSALLMVAGVIFFNRTPAVIAI